MFKELSENFKSMKKCIETIKNNQSKMKGTLTEMKNNLWAINSRVDEAEDQISDLEYMGAKTPNQNREKNKKPKIRIV